MPNWGRQSTASLTTVDISSFIMCGGVSPDLANMRLDSISVFGFATDGVDSFPRVALYRGGVENDPTGATLVEDLGPVAMDAGTNFRAVASTTPPTIPRNTQIWIAVKCGGETTRLHGRSTNPEDFNGTSARLINAAVTGGFTAANAFPSSIDATSTASARWYNFYLTYSIVEPEEGNRVIGRGIIRGIVR